MADKNANFTEVLDIKVNLQSFQKSLNEALNAYKKFVADVQAVGAADTKGAKSTFSALKKGMTDLTTIVNTANVAIAQSVDAITEKLDKFSNAAEKTYGTVGKTAKQAAKEAEAEAKKAKAQQEKDAKQAQKDKLAQVEAEEKALIKRKKEAFERIERLRDFNKGFQSANAANIEAGLSSDVSFLRARSQAVDVVARQKALEKEILDAHQLQERSIKSFNKELDKRVELERQLEEKLSKRNRDLVLRDDLVALENLSNAEQEAAKKQSDALAAKQKQQQIIETEANKRRGIFQKQQLQDLAELSKAEQARFEEEEKRLDEAQRQAARRYNIKVARDKAAGSLNGNETTSELKTKLDLARKSQEMRDALASPAASAPLAEAQRDFDRTQKAILDAEQRSAAQRYNVQQRRRQEEEKAEAVHQAKLELLQRNASRIKNQNLLRNLEFEAKNRNISVAQFRKSLTDTVAASNTAGSAISRFFGSLTKNFAESAGTAIKYALVFKAFSAVAAGALAALSAPFALLSRGVGFLAQLEQSSLEIEQALIRSAKFTGDQAEQLRKAKDYAKELAIELDEVSAEIGIEQQTLSGITTIALNSGLLNFTNQKKDILDFVKTYALGVKGFVQGSLAVAASITDITDLFNSTGEGLDNNKFLKAIGLTAQEWVKMRDASRDNLDLMQRLAKQVELVELTSKATEGTFTRLTKQLLLALDLMIGKGTAKFFTDITNALSEILKQLKNDEIGKQLADTFSILIDSVGSLILELFRLAKAFAQSASGKVLFGSIVTLITQVNNGLTLLTGTLTFLFNLVNGLFSLSPTKLLEAFTEFGKVIDGAANRVFDLLDVLQGKRLPSNRPTVNENPTAKNNPIPKQQSLAGAARAELEAEKARLELLVETVRENRSKLIQVEREKEEDRLISQRELAERIKKIDDDSIKELNKYYNELINNVDKLKAVALQNEVDPIKQREIALSFLAQRRQIARNQIKDIQLFQNEERQAIRVGIREERKIREDAYKAALKLQEDSLKQELDILKESEALGFATKEEILYKELKLEETTLNNRQDILERELTTVNSYTERYSEIINELIALNNERTQFERTAAIKRITTRQEENKRVIESESKLRIAVLDTDLARVDLIKSLSGFNNTYLTIQDKLLGNKEKELITIERIKAAELALFKSRNQQSEKTYQLENELRDIAEQRAANTRARISALDSTVQDSSIRQLIKNSILRNSLNRARESAQTALLNSDDMSPEGVIQRDAVIVQTRKQVADAMEALKEAGSSFRNTLVALSENLLGDNYIERFKELAATKDPVNVFAGAVSLAGASLKAFANIADIARRGFEEGGLLGGIGAVGSALAPALSKLPVVGAFVEGFSAVFSFVGSLLTRSAKKLADEIKKDFDKAVEKLNSGGATLVDTIAAIEQQRQRAITSLSGKKGGKKELEKLLPDIDNELENLRKQQQEIISNFESELNLLKLNSDVLADTARTWDEINKKVKEYIGAGGDAAKASLFLEAQVSKLRQDAIEQLTEAEKDAVQTAIGLNDLLKDRQKLIDDFKKQEFDIIAGGAIERRRGIASRGQELAEARKQFQEQLKNLDDQIRLETIKVEKNRELFNLTNDIAELKRRDEEFTLKALDVQIEKIRQIQELVRGLNSGGQGFLNTLSSNVFNVTINAGAGSTGQQLADSFVDELETRFRLGLT